MLRWFGWTSIGIILSLIFLQSPLLDWMRDFRQTIIGQRGDSIAHRANISEAAWRDSVYRRRQWLKESTVRALFPTKEKNDGEPYVVWDFFPPAYTCPWDVQRLGRLGDYGKWVCGMSIYESVTSRPIIVYSFGVSNDSSFEAEMLARTNAEVFAFDFSTDGFGPEVGTTHDRAYFEKIGVHEENSNRNGTEFQSLKRIMQRHGHTYIDIVKMDIEGDEFPALSAFMDEYIDQELPIGQLLIEIHLFDVSHTVQEFTEWWDRFEGFGLRPVWCEANLITVTWDTGYPCCAEYVWINTNDTKSLLWV